MHSDPSDAARSHRVVIGKVEPLRPRPSTWKPYTDEQIAAVGKRRAKCSCGWSADFEWSDRRAAKSAAKAHLRANRASTRNVHVNKPPSFVDVLKVGGAIAAVVAVIAVGADFNSRHEDDEPRRSPALQPAVNLPVNVPSGGASGDLDCADIGHEVYVGANDPNRLDADGDGVGCEGW